MQDKATIERIRQAELRRDPFDHAVVDGFLEPDLFEALRRSYPRPETMPGIAGRGTGRIYSDRRLFANADDLAGLVDAVTGMRPFDRLLGLIRDQAFTAALLGLFTRTVTAQLQGLSGRIQLQTTQADVIYDRTGFELAPHTDGPLKLATVLVYLADPGDPLEHGTRLYRPKDPRLKCETGTTVYHPSLFNEAATAPYRPNVAMMFARSPVSFHGVSASTSEIPRRVIQIPVKFTPPKKTAAG